MRKPAPLAAALVVLIAGVACGRPLPEDAPVATGPVQTGAFEEPAAEGAIRAGGAGPAAEYLAAVGDALAAVDPTVALRVTGEDAAEVCTGGLDVAATTEDAELCEEAVGFLVAEGVVFHVNRESLLERFEVESLIQHAVDNGETLPQEAGLEPLPIDVLQETQTKLEQVIAGVDRAPGLAGN